MGHMGAQLVGAAGDWLEREPGERARRGLDHGIVGHRVAGALVAMPGDPHDRLVLALLLGQESRDAALRWLWHARNQRPVDLARRARAERLRERRSRKARLGDEQATRRVLVEPVHKTWTLAVRPRRPQ